MMRRSCRPQPYHVPTPLSPETRDLWCQTTVFRLGHGREPWTALLHPDVVREFSRLSLELGAEQGDGSIIQLSTSHPPRYISKIEILKS